MTSYLFVAPSTQSFGEVVLGLRIAEALRAAGHRVVFLAPAANEVLFRDAAIEYAHIDTLLPTFDRALLQAIHTHRCDAIVLVDLLVTVFAMISRRLDPALLDTLPVPVYALDIWDLRRAPLRVDLNASGIDLPESVRRIVPRRLVPVPFANLDAHGAYNALPAPAESNRSARSFSDEQRVVLVSTSGFQTHAPTAGQRRLLARVLGHLVATCLRIDDRVRVIHVGPEAVADMGLRYRHQAQVSASDYRGLLDAADLMVNMNQSATTISTALASELPSLVATSAGVPDALVSFPFRVFPFGMVEFIAQILRDNPYADAVATAELFPGDELVTAARALLFDSDVRAEQLARIRAYTAQVRALPDVATLVANQR